MISLILPYWNRQQATNNSLDIMARFYADLDLEVIIVDDGSTPSYLPQRAYPFRLVVKHLPRKSEPKNPVVPFNAGVKIATGEYIALSNPEMLHRSPILAEMRAEIQRGDDRTYVLAACWSLKPERWHSHSSRKLWGEPVIGKLLPKGAAFHFMSMMTRSMWNDTGGFDEDYRDGAGYDDPDFLMRLQRAGAKFVQRDDLIVDHTREGAHAEWTPQMFDRNRDVFLRKWAHAVV